MNSRKGAKTQRIDFISERQNMASYRVNCGFVLIVVRLLCNNAIAADQPKADLQARLARLAAITQIDNRNELPATLDSIAACLREMRAASLERKEFVKVGLVADVEIFVKGAQWALRYETEGQPTDSKLIQTAVFRFINRLKFLRPESSPVAENQPISLSRKRGRLVRGYVSAVDNSAQPYGLIVPAGYDPSKPIRLDVVLHGSTKPQGASELKFMERFDDGDSDSEKLVDQPFIELHPLGRVENCYRWGGETDV